MAPMVTATDSSSSTTSSLPIAMLLRGPGDRQRNAERGPPTFAAAQFDRTAVRLHDALRHPQAEPRALLFLRREKRLEDVRQVLLGDALAVVAYLDVDRVGHQKLGIG